MHNRILIAVTAVTLLFPGRPAAQASRPRPDAPAIVDRILVHREELSLTQQQVDDLAARCPTRCSAWEHGSDPTSLCLRGERLHRGGP